MTTPSPSLTNAQRKVKFFESQGFRIVRHETGQYTLRADGEYIVVADDDGAKISLMEEAITNVERQEILDIREQLKDHLLIAVAELTDALSLFLPDVSVMLSHHKNMAFEIKTALNDLMNKIEDTEDIRVIERLKGAIKVQQVNLKWAIKQAGDTKILRKELKKYSRKEQEKVEKKEVRLAAIKAANADLEKHGLSL